MHFTKRELEAISTSGTKGVWHADDVVQGFACVTYPTGAVVFYARYRHGSQRRVVRIGRYGVLTVEQARAKAKEILSAAALGLDPAGAREAAKAAPTFSEFTTAYLTAVAGRKVSTREDERFLGMAVSRWKDRRLDAITPDDIQLVFNDLSTETPIGANRWLASVRACFSEAVRKGKVPTNPAKAVRPNRENDPRRRVFDDDEMKRILIAIEDERKLDPFASAAFQILARTGLRTSEVLRARWENVNLEDGTLLLPRPKNQHPRVVALPGTVVEILAALPRRGPHVIGVAPRGRVATIGKPRERLSSSWDRITVAAGIENGHVHDLRRSFVTRVARESGVYMASKVAGHSSVAITERVYAQENLEQLRAASEKHGELLDFKKKA